MPLLSKKKTSSNVSIEIPVLCKFWREDEVWNGVAEDIPVAVYGATFEQAQQHMQDAILSHLETLQQLDRLRETINVLRRKSRERSLCEAEIPLNQSLVRMSATLHNEQLLSLI